MTRTASLPALHPSLDFETRYTNLIDAQFIARAMAAGASCVRGRSWPTRTLYDGAGEHVLASAYYEYNRQFEALALVEGALAHIIRTGDTISVRLAASDHATLDRAERRLREELPEPEPGPSDEVSVEFAHWSTRVGVALTTRTIPAPSLAAIRPNYSAGVASSLEQLVTGFDPVSRGRLLLWHGPPGCGKTWALRALASEWRSWCTVRYVSDPEILLSEPEYLVTLLHRRPSGRHPDDAWRLIVMEDTGELLSADAKERTGQGLSRLLNVVDGLMGDTARAMFLVTTNEDLRTLHPAVSRPGRCGHVVRFDPLGADEANAWLEAHGAPASVAGPATLAELYGVLAGQATGSVSRRPVGFAP